MLTPSSVSFISCPVNGTYTNNWRTHRMLRRESRAFSFTPYAMCTYRRGHVMLLTRRSSYHYCRKCPPQLNYPGNPSDTPFNVLIWWDFMFTHSVWQNWTSAFATRVTIYCQFVRGMQMIASGECRISLLFATCSVITLSMCRLLVPNFLVMIHTS